MKTETICREVPCCPSNFERPRYYARQLITSDDLTLEQEYFRSKLKLHNRMLHGWGVVCGAVVCLVPKKKDTGYEPWQVLVKPGYALDPCGNEINIDCARAFDVRTRGITGVTGEPCVEAIDPWCSEVFEDRPDDNLYVAVRYKQFATRPVRVQPLGCGCDDTRCENSRWRDGYEISILNYCPDSHTDPPDIDDLRSGPIPNCPDCPDDSWVVLARIIVDDAGAIQIDNCECRRLVFSFKDFWWACEEAPACTKFSEYAATATEEEKLRHLQGFADKLSSTGSEGAILAYGTKAGESTTSGEEARKLLLDQMKVDPKRITLTEGVGRARIELWLCPKGAPKPTATEETDMRPHKGPQSKASDVAGAEFPGKPKAPKKGRPKNIRGNS